MHLMHSIQIFGRQLFVYVGNIEIAFAFAWLSLFAIAKTKRDFSCILCYLRSIRPIWIHYNNMISFVLLCLALSCMHSADRNIDNHFHCFFLLLKYALFFSHCTAWWIKVPPFMQWQRHLNLCSLLLLLTMILSNLFVWKMKSKWVKSSVQVVCLSYTENCLYCLNCSYAFFHGIPWTLLSFGRIILNRFVQTTTRGERRKEKHWK